jgi:hypothetical protein
LKSLTVSVCRPIRRDVHRGGAETQRKNTKNNAGRTRRGQR